METNQYPKSVSFSCHDTEGLTEDAKRWLERINSEVKMTLEAENVLRIEYPSDIVSQIRTVNIDDCIYRLDFIDPDTRFSMIHCVFPDVPWNNRIFMQKRWKQVRRTGCPGILKLHYPANN